MWLVIMCKEYVFEVGVVVCFEIKWGFFLWELLRYFVDKIEFLMVLKVCFCVVFVLRKLMWDVK